jgi:hypothetical protein
VNLILALWALDLGPVAALAILRVFEVSDPIEEA